MALVTNVTYACAESSKRIGIFNENESGKASRKQANGPGPVAHACNLNTLGGHVGGSQGQEFETNLANMVKPRVY